MLDIQTVYTRDVANLKGVDFLTTIRLYDFYWASKVTKIEIDGIETSFSSIGPFSLFVSLPPNGLTAQGLSDAGAKISLHVDTVGDGVGDSIISIPVPTYNEESLSGGHVYIEDTPAEQEHVNELVPPKAIFENVTLKLKCDDCSEATEVRVNTIPVPFIILNSTHIICLFTDYLNFGEEITDIQVITASKEPTALSQTKTLSYYEHTVGNLQLIQKESKLLNQFTRLLLTTRSQDIFEPDIGGNFRNWVGQNFSSPSGAAMVAKSVMSITETAARMMMTQLMSDVPSDEVIAEARLVDFIVDPRNPTVAEIIISVRTIAGTTEQLTLALDKAQDVIVDAAEERGNALGTDITSTFTGGETAALVSSAESY